MDDHIVGTPEEAWRDNAERRYREGRRHREIEIIKLLEAIPPHGGLLTTSEWAVGFNDAIAEVILLIKGEEPNA